MFQEEGLGPHNSQTLLIVSYKVSVLDHLRTYVTQILNSPSTLKGEWTTDNKQPIPSKEDPGRPMKTY